MRRLLGLGRIVVAGALSLVVSGCATVQLSSMGVVPYAFRSHPGAPTVAVAKLQDARPRPEDLGIIGASPIRTKDDIARSATEILLQELNDAGYNIQRAEETASVPPAGTNALLRGTLEKTHMHSMDAILQPVELELQATLEVISPDGRVAYRKTYFVNPSKRMGISMGAAGGWQAKFLTEGFQDLAARTVQDDHLKKALGKTDATGEEVS